MYFARFGGSSNHRHVPWNRGKLLGQKPPLKLKEIWAIEDAEAWRKAKDIRFYVQAMGTAVKEGQLEAALDTLESWTEWALKSADRIDPCLYN